MEARVRESIFLVYYVFETAKFDIQRICLRRWRAIQVEIYWAIEVARRKRACLIKIDDLFMKWIHQVETNLTPET